MKKFYLKLAKYLVKGDNIKITANDKGNIDIEGDCYIPTYDGDTLPFKINTVKGNFTVGDVFHTTIMNITSLTNFPDTVYGNFDVNGMYKLKSLKGGPGYVDGNYKCGSLHLKSLEGIASDITGNLFIANNDFDDLSILETINFKKADLNFCEKVKYSDIYKKLKSENRLFEEL